MLRTLWKSLFKGKAESQVEESVGAQYTAYTLDIAYWKSRVTEAEETLKVTKQTVARKKVERLLTYRKEQLAFYERQQALALGLIAEGEGTL